MSNYTILFAPSSKHAVCLFRRMEDITPPFQGIVVYLGKHRYWLSRKYLTLFIKRFTEMNDGNVLYVEDSELWDTDKYLKKGEDTFDVGGDRAIDIPIKYYLPEISDDKVIAEIIADKSLLIE